MFIMRNAHISRWHRRPSSKLLTKVETLFTRFCSIVWTIYSLIAVPTQIVSNVIRILHFISSPTILYIILKAVFKTYTMHVQLSDRDWPVDHGTIFGHLLGYMISALKKVQWNYTLLFSEITMMTTVNNYSNRWTHVANFRELQDSLRTLIRFLNKV